MLKTKHRLRLILQACLETKQPFVVDNTNVTNEVRASLFPRQRERGFGLTVFTTRSQLKTDLELPMRDEYGAFVRNLIDAATSNSL
ncbi:MAG TPA: hypothetical protein VF088_04375 [Pyrinomonadaceae bacterium]